MIKNTKISRLFSLKDRIALVTGAARGLGRSMAIAFAEAGAHLLLADLNKDGMESTANYIRELKRQALTYVCDVSDINQIGELFNYLDKEYGKVDILGNVAGEGIIASPEEITLEQVIKVFQVLAIGRFYITQQAGKRMLARGKGSIISVGSLASISALGRGHIAYSMAMAAVAQMTRELSTEWSARGVRVNAILPAQIINPSLEKRMELDANLKGTFLRGIPINRLGEPKDIMGAAVFLASDASAWITGVLLPLDGGNLAMNAGGSVSTPTNHIE